MPAGHPFGSASRFDLAMAIEAEGNARNPQIAGTPEAKDAEG